MKFKRSRNDCRIAKKEEERSPLDSGETQKKDVVGKVGIMVKLVQRRTVRAVQEESTNRRLKGRGKVGKGKENVQKGPWEGVQHCEGWLMGQKKKSRW